MSDLYTISEFHQEEGCWLDDDGQHIWFAHRCKTDGNRDEKATVTMLPWPNWQTLDGTSVYPSISCEGCGFHHIANIGRRVP